jgi:hypothetical protein
MLSLATVSPTVASQAFISSDQLASVRYRFVFLIVRAVVESKDQSINMNEQPTRISFIRPPLPQAAHVSEDERADLILRFARRVSNIELAKSVGMELVGTLITPADAQKAFRSIFKQQQVWVKVVGPVEDRLLLVAQSNFAGLAVSFGSGIDVVARERSALIYLQPLHGEEQIGRFELSSAQYKSLFEPRIVLAALYHPEHFPLPRFPLGISDLARALRTDWIGEVALYDMQLGETVDSIMSATSENKAQILGISATFGQYDLLKELLARLETQDNRPIVVVGGSLGVLLHESLLRDSAVDFVAMGAGEATIQGIAKYFLGEIAKEHP